MVVTSSIREALLHVMKSMPAAPAVLAELGRMLLYVDADLDDAIRLLKRDPALTARIIRLANSVIYGAGTRSGSLEKALARVGFNEVYRLAGLAALAEVSAQQVPLYRIRATELRENAVLTALIMERLAEAAGQDPRTAYTVGLLRGVGRIALDRIAPAAVQRSPYSPDQHGPVGDWERVQLGLTNCDAAALVLENWRLPRVSVHAIRDQYLETDPGGPLAQWLNLAAGAAELAGHGLPGERSYWAAPDGTAAETGVDERTLTRAMRDALEIFGPIRLALA